MTVQDLPPAPSRGSDRSNFREEADVFVAALQPFGQQINETAAQVNSDAGAAAGSASAAAGSASNAAGSASAAAQSALIAQGAANYQGEYDAGTFYAVGESVTYLGSQFIKKTTAPAGTAPVDGTDWLEIKWGGIASSSTSGTTQQIDFSENRIHSSLVDEALVTYEFINPSNAARVDLILEGVGITPYSVDQLSYEGETSTASEEYSASAIRFNPDGTKMYIVGDQSDNVHQYSLAVAWDVSTAVYDNVFIDTVLDNQNPFGIALKPDGTKLYLVSTYSKSVVQYTMSTAWDLSTATLDAAEWDFTAKGYYPYSLNFSSDGTKVYIGTNGNVYQHSLSTPWDLDTVSANADYFLAMGAYLSNGARGVTFSADGTSVLAARYAPSELHKFTLTAAWDLATATYDGSGSLSGKVGSGKGIEYGDGGNKLYMSDGNGSLLRQFQSMDPGTLVFPDSIESPPIPISSYSKVALTIVTADEGSTYQVINVQEGIA